MAWGPRGARRSGAGRGDCELRESRAQRKRMLQKVERADKMADEIAELKQTAMVCEAELRVELRAELRAELTVELKD